VYVCVCELFKLYLCCVFFSERNVVIKQSEIKAMHLYWSFMSHLGLTETRKSRTELSQEVSGKLWTSEDSDFTSTRIQNDRSCSG